MIQIRHTLHVAAGLLITAAGVTIAETAAGHPMGRMPNLQQIVGAAIGALGFFGFP